MESGIIKYNTAIVSIKNAIMQSRFKAASLVNRELLSLYFGIGEFISQNTRNKNRGKGAIDVISARLQQELPGLKGFSASNLKDMRLFYEEWKDYFLIRQLTTAELEKTENQLSNRQLTTADLKEDVQKIEIRQLPTAELESAEYEIRQLTTDELGDVCRTHQQSDVDDKWILSPFGGGRGRTHGQNIVIAAYRNLSLFRRIFMLFCLSSKVEAMRKQRASPCPLQRQG